VNDQGFIVFLSGVIVGMVLTLIVIGFGFLYA